MCELRTSPSHDSGRTTQDEFLEQVDRCRPDHPSSKKPRVRHAVVTPTRVYFRLLPADDDQSTELLRLLEKRGRKDSRDYVSRLLRVSFKDENLRRPSQSSREIKARCLKAMAEVVPCPAHDLLGLRWQV
jgi:hypothetical protein